MTFAVILWQMIEQHLPAFTRTHAYLLQR